MNKMASSVDLAAQKATEGSLEENVSYLRTNKSGVKHSVRRLC